MKQQTERLYSHRKQAVAYYHFSRPANLIVYRSYIQQLLDSKKPMVEQIGIELSALNALRTGEVCTVQVEDFDFTDQVIWVLDSKKHEHLPKPLHPTLGFHVEEYIRENHLSTGFLLQKRTLRGRPAKQPQPTNFEPQTIQVWWAKGCRRLGLPQMTPRSGRAYCVCMASYYWEPRASTKEIQVLLGHTDIQSTEHYLNALIDFDWVKDRFLERWRRILQSDKSPLQKCLRFDSCPGSMPDCYCKAYMPGSPKSVQNETHLERPSHLVVHT
jgi:integrase